MNPIMKFAIFLSKRSIIINHGAKIRTLLMIYPYIAITYLNHWLAGMIGGASCLIISGLVIKWFEEESGMSYYMERTMEREFYHRLNAIKIIFLFVVSIPFVYFFSKVNPIRLIYLSGLPNG